MEFASTNMEAIIGDPIGTLVDETRKLETTERSSFVREWLLRSLQIELHRYSMEDAFIDTGNVAFKEAVAALAALRDNSDWISTPLENYLLAFRDAARLPQLPYSKKKRAIESNGHTLSVIERHVDGANAFWISNTSATVLPILEESLGMPEECKSVFDAFAHRLTLLKQTRGITRLCFIEKEMGPVGAISMLSSLVMATGLPACIYRETHWTRDMAIAADRPQANDRLAIVYDLVVTGAGIRGAADHIKELSGASTVAAVVLCGYGAKRSHLETGLNPDIALEALDWRTHVHGPAFEYSPSRGGHEVPSTRSEPREKPREGASMGKGHSDRTGQTIPPGDYDRQTLPSISAAALEIVNAIKEAAVSDPQPTAIKLGPRGLLRIKRRPSSGLRIKRPTR